MGEIDRAYRAHRTSQPAGNQNVVKAQLIRDINLRIPVTETKLRENGFPIVEGANYGVYAIRHQGHLLGAYVYSFVASVSTDPRRAVAFHVDGVGTAKFLKCDALTTPDSEFFDANLQDFEPAFLRTLYAWLEVLQKAPKAKPWVVPHRPPLPI